MSDQTNYRARQRIRAVENLGGSCVECGQGNPELLDIDHVEPINRAVILGTGRKPSTQAIQQAARGDTDGLQLLCNHKSPNNCHGRKTAAEAKARAKALRIVKEQS